MSNGVYTIQDSTKKRLLETIRFASADYQDLQGQFDELKQRLDRERSGHEELRSLLEQERKEHAEQMETATKEAEMKMAMLQQEKDGIAMSRCALAASVDASARQAQVIEQDLQCMVTALERILPTAVAAAASAKPSPATPAIDYSTRSGRGTPTQHKRGEEGAASRNGPVEVDPAPSDWKEQLAQANREVATR